MENQQSREVSAKTVDEAIEIALLELGAGREEVEVEVLSRGKAGFLGIGSELARVRVHRLASGDNIASQTMVIVNKLLRALGTTARPTLRSAHGADVGGPVVDIEGEDSGLLIGRRGETLRALQFIVNLIVNKDRTEPARVLLDVEQYRERRYKALGEMAQRIAEKVAETGRPVTLEPMSSAERRIVHVTLTDHPRVTTESAGLGAERRVTIAPKKP